MKRASLLLLILMSGLLLQAQNSSEVDSLLHLAFSQYQVQNYSKAKVEFMKVHQIDSMNVDAVYNLGVVCLQLKQTDEAIGYFHAGVRLRDRQSAKVLKGRLNQKIEYADFMHFADVTQLPQFLVKNQPNDFLVEESINKKLQSAFTNALKKSSVIRKSKFSGQLYLNIEVDRNGNTICKMTTSTGNGVVDQEIKRVIEQSVKWIPGKYDDQDVGVWGWIVPLSI